MVSSGNGEDDLKSKHFGDVQVGYTYDFKDMAGEPLSQSGGFRSKYLVINCVPTLETRDSEYYVNKLQMSFLV